jgi:hypothetical protein
MGLLLCVLVIRSNESTRAKGRIVDGEVQKVANNSAHVLEKKDLVVFRTEDIGFLPIINS